MVVHRDRLSVLELSFLWGACSGIFLASFSVVVVVAFAAWGNAQNRLTNFLGRGAYTVYLIQSFVIFLLVLVWVSILRAAGVDPFQPPNDWFVVAGGMFLTFAGLPVTWTIAWYICRIPGLKDIL